MIDESSLPVGSCVKLLNNSKTIMVAGYCPYDEQEQIMYDYIGIYVPIGIRKPKKEVKENKDYIFFKSSNIERVLFIGYSNDNSDFYLKYLSNVKKKINDNKIDIHSRQIIDVIKESIPNNR